jgi:hypothetical protein
MVRVDAASRAEVVLRHACIEPINGQRIFAGVERDAAGVGGHRYRTAHPAVRAGAAAGSAKAVGQFHAEAHRATVACRFHFPFFIPLHRQAPNLPKVLLRRIWRRQRYHIEWAVVHHTKPARSMSAVGHEPPRSLVLVAAEVPHKADTNSDDQRSLQAY